MRMYADLNYYKEYNNDIKIQQEHWIICGNFTIK